MVLRKPLMWICWEWNLGLSSCPACATSQGHPVGHCVQPDAEVDGTSGILHQGSLLCFYLCPWNFLIVHEEEDAVNTQTVTMCCGSLLHTIALIIIIKKNSRLVFVICQAISGFPLVWHWQGTSPLAAEASNVTLKTTTHALMRKMNNVICHLGWTRPCSTKWTHTLGQLCIHNSGG